MATSTVKKSVAANGFPMGGEKRAPRCRRYPTKFNSGRDIPVRRPVVMSSLLLVLALEPRDLLGVLSEQ